MTWLLALILTAAPTPPASSDVAAARALFEKNLDAIRRRDKAAYLSTYWKSDQLARTGADGIALGYASHEKSAGENWPDTFDASDLEAESHDENGVDRRREQGLDPGDELFLDLREARARVGHARFLGQLRRRRRVESQRGRSVR